MRKITTGVDADGRSCIVEVAEVTTGAVPSIDYLTMAQLYTIDTSPPPAGPDQTGHFMETHLPPGHVRVSVFDHLGRDTSSPLARSAEMHYSAKIDLMWIVSGSIRLIMEVDEIDLVEGDFVICPGTVHALVQSPEGCRMLGFQIGAPAPASASASG